MSVECLGPKFSRPGIPTEKPERRQEPEVANPMKTPIPVRLPEPAAPISTPREPVPTRT